MSIYLQIEGIKGSITSKNFTGAIELMETTQAAKRRVHQNINIGKEREFGMVTVTEMQVIKLADTSSPDLHHALYAAKIFPKAKINVCYGDNDSTRLQYTLHDVLLTGIHDQVDEQGHVIETIGLNYTAIEKKYSFKDAQGKLGAPKITGYKLDTAEIM